MGAYLITYDLHDKSKENDLLAYIRTNGYAMVSESSYVVLRDTTSGQIVSDIKRITGDRVNVYVFGIGSSWNSFGPQQINDWLSRNVR
jgi:CRISPR/Cas system-associated endoribonuclease Cas2